MTQVENLVLQLFPHAQATTSSEDPHRISHLLRLCEASSQTQLEEHLPIDSASILLLVEMTTKKKTLRDL